MLDEIKKGEKEDVSKMKEYDPKEEWQCIKSCFLLGLIKMKSG